MKPPLEDRSLHFISVPLHRQKTTLEEQNSWFAVSFLSDYFAGFPSPSQTIALHQ